MIQKINTLKKDIKNKKITIIGAGISGQGAALLANLLGAKVLISDIKKPKKINKNLNNKNIVLEFGKHSKKCLDADFIIVSPGINLNKIKILKNIDINKTPIISEIEFASWFTKSPIIAVTGSNGKSTVVKLLYTIFKKNFSNVLLGGNIGNSLSENIIFEKNNTVSDIHIVEVSSFQLENIFTFKPKVSCVINITEDHMERYDDIQDYVEAKFKITKNHDNETFIVYNEDDSRLKKYYQKYINNRPFSLRKNIFDVFVDKTYITIKDSNDKISLEEIQLIGSHNYYNIISAITIAKIFNIKNKMILKALKEFKPLKHRLEKLQKYDGINFINDSKGTNIFSTKAAINSFKKNIILILGGSKGKIENSIFEDVLNKKHIIHIVCYGEAGKELTAIFNKTKPTKYSLLFKDAVIKAIKLAKKDDTILLSPAFKSYDQFNNFEERGNKFEDIIKHYYA